jgi:hypothetical protein
MRLLQSERVTEVGAGPSEAFVKSMRAAARDISGKREFVASATACEFAGGLHQMLADSGGARLGIDDNILDDRERLQRVSKVRDDDYMAGADDLAGGLGYEDRVMAVAREPIECGRELRRRNTQLQVIV